MTRDEFLKKSGDKSKVKGYEEFGEAGNNDKKNAVKPYSIYKEPDKPKPPKPPTPTPPAGGAALPVPKAAMKHEGFKSFSEWLETRTN